jgi:hypothetical protein
MEAIDAGDVPLEQVIEQLLKPIGLKKLLGHHGSACFVLARAALAPQFFDRLIQNVVTIDATTRSHIAFVVFHGNKSSILRPGPKGPGSYYRNHIEGISVSEHGDGIKLEYPSDSAELSFNDQLADAVRIGEGRSPGAPTAMATELAVTFLMKRFRLLESALPCLVFVDGDTLSEPVVVPLSRSKTIESLYSDVLIPLSDSFSHLQEYWSEKNDIYRLERNMSRELDTIAQYPAKRAALEFSLDKNRAALARLDSPPGRIDQMREERATLVVCCEKYKAASSLDERILLLPPGSALSTETESLRKRLMAYKAQREKAKTTNLDEACEEELKRLTATINRMRTELGTLASKPLDEAKRRIMRLDSKLPALQAPIRKLRDEEKSILAHIGYLERDKSSAQNALSKRPEAAIEQKKEDL